VFFANSDPTVSVSLVVKPERVFAQVTGYQHLQVKHLSVSHPWYFGDCWQCGYCSTPLLVERGSSSITFCLV